MKVSIITVCKNAKDSIEETIESVLKQSYQDIEYIVIDGGSHDGTREVLLGYKDKVSKVIFEKDDGIYDAMNKGLKIAKGEIIGILNADDYYLQDTIKDIHEVFVNSKADIVYGKMYVFNSEFQILKAVNEDIPTNVKNNKLHRVHPTCFIKRGCYQNLSFDSNLKVAGDLDLLNNLIKDGYEIKKLDKFLTVMRDGGRSANFSLEYLKIIYRDIGVITMIKELFKYLVRYLMKKIFDFFPKRIRLAIYKNILHYKTKSSAEFIR